MPELETEEMMLARLRTSQWFFCESPSHDEAFIRAGTVVQVVGAEPWDDPDMAILIAPGSAGRRWVDLGELSKEVEWLE